MTPAERAEVEEILRAAERAIADAVRRPRGIIPQDAEDFVALASRWRERQDMVVDDGEGF